MIRRRAILVVLFFAITLPSRAALAVGCVGACSDPNMVQISDLLIGVDIALGLTRVSRCVAFDADNDGNVNVVELLQGVQNAIEGCVTPHYNPDKCSKAPPLSPVLSGDSALFSTDTATRATTDPALSCGCRESSHTLWSTFTPDGSGTATISVRDSAADSVVTVFSAECSAPAEIACSANIGGVPAPLMLPVTGGTNYVVEVSTPCEGAGGPLHLGIDVCGDGVVSRGEQCDDGNTVDGDGCSAGCAYEDLDGYDYDGGCARNGGDINIFLVAPIAQRFIPSRPLLGGVDVLLIKYNDPHMDTIALNLHADSLAAPVLASASALIGRLGSAWQHFRFDPAVPVIVGRTYVFELVGTNESINAHRRAATEECPFAYPNGGAIYGQKLATGEELIFRTYAASSQ